MPNNLMKQGGCIFALCVFAMSASAQETRLANANPHANPQAQDQVSHAVSTASAPARKARAYSGATKQQFDKAVYYVDFRARTAASYGHAFLWYGRMDQRAVEVAGLHPASDSVIPYILGHVVPVPSETGASYGDLDEEYLTASYRVVMTEEEARPVIAYIKQLQGSRPVWNAAVYNCVAFIQDVARFMGLRVPNTHLIYPEDWVNKLRALNGGVENQVVRLSDIKGGRVPKSGQTTEPTASAPAADPSEDPAPRQATAPAPRRAAAKPAQTKPAPVAETPKPAQTAGIPTNSSW
jgi:cell wall-associated NlpC family hydrolase